MASRESKIARIAISPGLPALKNISSADLERCVSDLWKII
jgi:hypothetical protein